MDSAKELIKSDLVRMIHTDGLHEMTALKISNAVNDRLDEWVEQTTNTLRRMVVEWEAAMGENDRSFYSLGLRRAIDAVTGRSFLEDLPLPPREDAPEE